MAIEDNPKVAKEPTPILLGDNPKVSPLTGKDKDLNEKGFFNRPRAGGKTIWDWLNLLGVLAVPIAVTFATILFSLQQADLAQKQHDADQQNALEQQHATTLQTYIDNIQELLLRENLRVSKPNGEVAILARARTLTALQGLDPGRKGRLVQFLYEAQLIGFEDSMGKPQGRIIDLYTADLVGADLNHANLDGADLGGADLVHTNFVYANLGGAYLRGTYLLNANLSGADLRGACLLDANLSGADLSGANLSTVHLGGAYLGGAFPTSVSLYGGCNPPFTQQQLDHVSSCRGATLPTGFICHSNP